ncbi:MAG: hypothetical protein LBK62_05905 [Treponema sp.]|jgi:hypothetical protein|nr:hypothetical protein [Treponema sp.]
MNQVIDIPSTGEIVLTTDSRKMYVLRGAFPVDVDISFVNGMGLGPSSYICCMNTSNRNNTYYLHSEDPYAQGSDVIPQKRITFFYYVSGDAAFVPVTTTDPLLEALYYALFE